MQANPWGSSTRVWGAGKPMVPRDGSTRWGMCVCAHARMRRCLLKQRGQLRAAAEGMPACLAGNYYVTTTIAYTNTCTCVCVCTLHPTPPNQPAWLYAPLVHHALYTPKPPCMAVCTTGAPCTLHPQTTLHGCMHHWCTLHPTPYTLHPTPYTPKPPCMDVCTTSTYVAHDVACMRCTGCRFVIHSYTHPP